MEGFVMRKGFTLIELLVVIAIIGYPNTADTNCGEYAIHSGGSNYCFVDGHVKWSKPDAMRNIQRWFVDAP